jgi:arsenite/tail-anchored protein-transporting ATPase
MADLTTPGPAIRADALVETSMLDFVEEHPDLRYVFFGGKGGVGKTVLAGVAAVAMARRGRRTLLASTNPVHSLSGCLDQDVFGEHTPVDGVDGLWALEIDTKQAIARAQADIKEKISWFLKFAEIKAEADEFIEAAALNPAFEESAMFENMIDLIFADDYDVYVFDTAPTANARRLLGMSKVYGLWVHKMIKSRESAQTMRSSLSITKKEETDPLMDYLIEFQQRIAHAKDLLTDPEKTSFFFVTLPEALPIAVIRRFIDWFSDFGIPVGGVVVNQVITRELIEGEVPEFVRNRMEMQDEYLDVIHDEFDGLVRGVLPLYEEDLRGVQMLGQAAAALFEEGRPMADAEVPPTG